MAVITLTTELDIIMQVQWKVSDECSITTNM
jgi:hypothetical protein